jgi:hypothetical protein
MQFVSKESSTVGFSLPASISSFSLHFPGVHLRIGREYDQDHGQQFHIRPSMDFKEAEDADARSTLPRHCDIAIRFQKALHRL